MHSELIKLFTTFFKIGLFTIGGGYAMIPLIEKDIVERHKWVSKEDFLDLLAVAQSAPGVFAVNISVFIGYKLKRKSGAIAAATGCIMPSLIIILIIAIFFRNFRDNEVVNNVFKGLRPAVVALIAAPVFSLAKNARINWKNIWIPILSTLLIVAMGVSPMYIIILAIIGAIIWDKAKGGAR